MLEAHQSFFGSLRNHVLRYIFAEMLYTIIIIFITIGVTYTILAPKVAQKTQGATMVPNVHQAQQIPVDQAVKNTPEDTYVERGSPYDNRTIGSESSNVIFHGRRDKKQIALTFDAEMTEGMRARYQAGITKSLYDKRIIDTLIATHTKATLFLTGMWIELYPDITKEFSQNPLFELGSHSYTDSSYAGFCYGLYQLPNTLKIEDIGATEKLLREHANIDNRLFRFPGGCYTPDDVKLVNQANDTVVHWDVVGADGFNSNTNQIIHNVVDNTQNGSIIILHMNGAPYSPKTADALPEIIRKLKAKGFEFVKINELLGFPPEPKG